jgi:hypothetical protein
MTNESMSMSELVQKAVNAYLSGVAVVISAKDGGPLHGHETFAEHPGVHLCVSFPNVDRAEFEQYDARSVLEQARHKYVKLWQLRQEESMP